MTVYLWKSRCWVLLDNLHSLALIAWMHFDYLLERKAAHSKEPEAARDEQTSRIANAAAAATARRG